MNVMKVILPLYDRASHNTPNCIYTHTNNQQVLTSGHLFSGFENLANGQYLLSHTTYLGMRNKLAY